MHAGSIENALKDLTILYDTREQPSEKLTKRLEATGCPCERVKLNFGDYSAKCGDITLADSVVIERKMNLSELAMCFGSERARFKREFERAKEAGAKVYLLTENCDWDVLFSDSVYKRYTRSKYSRQAMLASLTAWQARYHMSVVFCNEKNTGQLIREILYREMKERLKNGVD